VREATRVLTRSACNAALTLVTCAALLAACDDPAPEMPRPLRVEPSSALQGEPTSIVIHGEGFAPVVRVSYADPSRSQVITTFPARLGEHSLEEVIMVDSETLTAVVPAALPAGSYALTVVAPTDQQGELASAFTVVPRATELDSGPHTGDGSLDAGVAADGSLPDVTPENLAHLDTAAQDQSMLDQAAPDLAITDAALLDTAAEDRAGIDAATPDVLTPDGTAPDVAVPDSNLPDSTAADVSAADASRPDGGGSDAGLGPGCLMPPCALPLGGGDGTFAQETDLSTETTYARGLALGDLDRDGILDLVVGVDGNTNRLYRGDGLGGFDSGADVASADLHGTYCVALGDLDRDGDLDLVVGNLSEINRVYLGDGAGDFNGGADIAPLDLNATYAIALGDISGDGVLDLVVGNLGEPDRLYLGDGLGGFDSGADLGTASASTQAVAIGDLDGNGALDVVIGQSGGANLLLLNNAGLGSPVEIVPADTHNSYAVVIVPLDADGAPDLLVGNGLDVNRVYLNDGSGGFNAGDDLSADTHNTKVVALGDLDGDGHFDAVIGNGKDGPDPQVDVIHFGDGAGGFGAPVALAPANPTTTRDIVIGDLNRDGALDLVVGTASGATIRIFLGQR